MASNREDMRPFHITKNCSNRRAAQRVVVAVLLLAVALPGQSQISRRSKQAQQKRHQAKVRLTAEDVARLYLPAVVLIIGEDANGDIVQGSGFFISRRLIVTNHHVIEGMRHGKVKLAALPGRKRTTLPINSILAVDANVDLALLSINRTSSPGSDPESSGLPPDVAELLAIGKQAKGATKTTRPSTSALDDIDEFLESESTPRLATLYEPVRIGETIYVLGNPDGLFGSISEGIVSGIRRTNASTLIQITAAISPGSSGGPVINTRGQVIGVVVASLTEGQNLNFAIPSENVRSLLTQYHR